MSNMSMRKLGRQLNPNTLMWEFPDGSGAIPFEIMSEIESHVLGGEKGGFILGMGVKWAYEEKMKQKEIDHAVTGN